MPCSGEYLRLLPLLHSPYVEKKNMAQMEQIKAPKIELSNEEMANLSDAEFKTLVIRMLTEMTECGHNIEEEVKAVQSKIKKNIQEPIVKGRKSGLKSMIWKQKEEINIQLE